MLSFHHGGLRVRSKKRWMLVVLVAVFAGLLAVATLRKGEARVAKPGWPADLAHRGSSLAAPENTMEAFRLAVEDGAGGLELDVHMTRDGEIVVLHDDTVDRTTDGTGAVRDMSLRELRGLDAGYRFTPDGGRTYPFRGRGVRVPTLGEIYEAFPETPVNVEIKEAQDGVEREVLRIVQEAGAEKRTIMASGRYPVIRRFRGLTDEVPTAASYREVVTLFTLSRLGLEGLIDPQYEAVQVPPSHRGIPVVTPRFLDAAHSLGLRVDVWTLNDPEDMHRMLDLGADGIITKRPQVLREVLRERGGP
jgi:glycerophosphoryl diester phosphodiesterase